MAIDSLGTWKSEGQSAITPVGPLPTAISTLADYVAARVDSKLALAAPVNVPISYTFGKAAFVGSLTSNLSIVPSLATAASTIATAWESGVNAATVVATSSGSIDPATAATTWSSPPTVTILPSSVSSAKGTLSGALANMDLVGRFDESSFAEALRDAFLALQFTVSGQNSVSPPAGPNPLSTVADVE